MASSLSLPEDLLPRLDTRGWAVVPGLVSAKEAAALRGLYETGNFRSHIIMARHGYGQGEYKYFAYPLPPLIADLRTRLYAELVPLANDWRRVKGLGAFPGTLEAFTARCHEAGQARPTPLILKYGPGDYNRLHQDLYGEMVFPLQVAVLLSRPGEDFAGGEFVITEQKPRSQSRADVIPLDEGDAVIFAVNERPVSGARGHFHVKMRHGVSEIREGERFTLGIIFHDAA